MPTVRLRDISPGPGQHGLSEARATLIKVIALAFADVLAGVDFWYFPDRKVEELRRGPIPHLRVTFDSRTKLWIDFWPGGPQGGFNPTWSFAHQQGGQFGEAALHAQRVDHERHVRPLLELVTRLLGGVTIVEQTDAQAFNEGSPRR